MRADWQQVHIAIKNAYIRLTTQLQRIPTEQEVADHCKIRRETVVRHLKMIDISEIQPPIRAFTDKIILALVKKALSGDVNAIKLCLQLGIDWSEKERYEEKVDLNVGEIKIVEIYRQTRDPDDDEGEG